MGAVYSAIGYCGFPSDVTLGERYAEISRKRRIAELKDKRDERMNLKLARHRTQLLKKRITIFAYILAAPLALTLLAYSWRLAIAAIVG